MAAVATDDLGLELARLLPLGGLQSAPAASIDHERGGAWTVVRAARDGAPTRRLVLDRADMLRLMALPGVRGVYAGMPSAERIELLADVENGETPTEHRRPLRPASAITRAMYAARVRTDAERAQAMAECSSAEQCDLVFDLCDLIQQCTAQLFGGTTAGSVHVTIKRIGAQTAVYVTAALRPPAMISHVLFEQLRGVAPDAIHNITAALEGTGKLVTARLTLLVGEPARGGKRRRGDDDDLPPAKRPAH